MVKKNFVILAVIFLNLQSMLAHAEEIIICTQVLPGKTEKASKENDSMTGLAGEIITKAFKDRDLKFKVQWLPWKRAQDETIQNLTQNMFIIPFSRNKERENVYTWVSKIYDAQTVFITKRNALGINKISEAKNKKIGVLFGSSYENTMMSHSEEIDVSKVLTFPNDSSILKSLESDKIDAWYTSILGAVAVFRLEKVQRENYVFGDIIDTETNYIATAKSTPKALVRKVKMAIESFKLKPEYQSLVKKYTIK